MENRIDILNELQSLSPTLAGLQKVNIYTVPLGYFDVLSNDILATLNIEKNNFLPNIKKQIGDVPQGYFDSLADNILSKIKQQQVDNISEELRSISPMLYSVQNQNVYTVPKNYFENLSDELVEKVQPTQAKVITMRKRNFTFIKYAVAAVFTGVIMFGAFKFIKLDNSGFTAKDYAQAKNTNVDEELNKVSDDEIVKYLEANGEDIDAALVANVIDEKELPTTEDYLTDDKALDNYLDNINLEDLKN
jgi:major membrane immunogen (membrane-anchored lipoprotein)